MMIPCGVVLVEWYLGGKELDVTVLVGVELRSIERAGVLQGGTPYLGLHRGVAEFTLAVEEDAGGAGRRARRDGGCGEWQALRWEGGGLRQLLRLAAGAGGGAASREAYAVGNEVEGCSFDVEASTAPALIHPPGLVPYKEGSRTRRERASSAAASGTT
jgi:hypothetical protein